MFSIKFDLILFAMCTSQGDILRAIAITAFHNICLDMMPDVFLIKCFVVSAMVLFAERTLNMIYVCSRHYITNLCWNKSTWWKKLWKNKKVVEMLKVITKYTICAKAEEICPLMNRWTYGRHQQILDELCLLFLMSSVHIGKEEQRNLSIS